ncbi:MotA/TolQ/ExbB proton channel family protein [Rheinheimera sp.]|uniref:MotA/TolQ/ExbB proton channel family protein n=1 Tax=Rheinheimera sp. TaxID=1869214 RepID=UPI00273585CD|nr:MotA/TolQ/ExbB proton channel family protein [Rheinheimera sp.]MDP2716528.1 MotA/TolQ/ExbB proton channel family protein [Rheinheimera sp.]
MTALADNPYGLATLWAQGDWVIKGVAILLLLMSVASWSVILWRSLQLWRLRPANNASRDFWHAQSFAQGLQLLQPGNSASPYRMLAEEGLAAVDHHRLHKADLHGQLSLNDWLSACLRNAIDDNVQHLQRGLPVLASVGSTAPFIGLFGTVWGIYHALVSIGVSGQAGIDKVAGPVGEALIMTAVGLAVAIPAVLGYNALQRANKGVITRLNRFAHQLHAYFLTGAAPKASVSVLTNKQESA